MKGRRYNEFTGVIEVYDDDPVYGRPSKPKKGKKKLKAQIKKLKAQIKENAK